MIQKKSKISTSSSVPFDCSLVSSKNDKFDINNVIILDETFKKITTFSTPKISTPGWREHVIEPLSSDCLPDEELDDQEILNRHKIVELKEKVNSSSRVQTMKEPKDLADGPGSFECLKSGSKFNFEWPERKFPLSEGEYEEMIKNT